VAPTSDSAESGGYERAAGARGAWAAREVNCQVLGSSVRSEAMRSPRGRARGGSASGHTRWATRNQRISRGAGAFASTTKSLSAPFCTVMQPTATQPWSASGALSASDERSEGRSEVQHPGTSVPRSRSPADSTAQCSEAGSQSKATSSMRTFGNRGTPAKVRVMFRGSSRPPVGRRPVARPAGSPPCEGRDQRPSCKLNA
jgi:hypothetical protein